MSACTGVILAGGMATRFGGLPKGLERVGGVRIIDRVAESLRGVTDNLIIIGNDAGCEQWIPGVRCETDVFPGLGSLAGIHSAVSHAASDVIVVAWDMPFVPRSLLAELRARGGMADVVVPESSSKRGVEPLCAFYAKTCRAAIEKRLAANERRVISFFGDVRVDRVPESTIAAYGDPAMIFLNVNTPDDLQVAETYASATDGRDRRPEA